MNLSQNIKGPTVVEVTPSHVEFIGPLNRLESHMYIQNVTRSTVAFKVKTTNPKIFEVKPNQGTLTPSEKVNIHMLIKDSSAVRQAINEKFLIQAAELPRNFDLGKFQEIWHHQDLYTWQSLKVFLDIRSNDHAFNNSLVRSPDRKSAIGTRAYGTPDNLHDGRNSAMTNNKGDYRENGNYSKNTIEYKQEHDKLVVKTSENEEKIVKLREERTKLFEEMVLLKMMLPQKNSKGKYARTYKLWEVLLVSVLSILIGAFLASS